MLQLGDMVQSWVLLHQRNPIILPTIFSNQHFRSTPNIPFRPASKPALLLGQITNEAKVPPPEGLPISPSCHIQIPPPSILSPKLEPTVLLGGETNSIAIFQVMHS